jgi:hypothetical protein
MSYDLYCYHSESCTPDAKQAQALFESEETTVQRDDDDARNVRRAIADALVECNPRLKLFEFDHNEIARQMKITYEQATAKWNHIELNPPEGDLEIQLRIHSDHVSIEIPYWYTDVKADQVFEQLSAYLRVIRESAGFLAYDPQTNRAFDPAVEKFGDHSEYDRVMKDLPNIIARATHKTEPWWKFW